MVMVLAVAAAAMMTVAAAVVLAVVAKTERRRVKILKKTHLPRELMTAAKVAAVSSLVVAFP
jgi:hypothetical protein